MPTESENLKILVIPTSDWMRAPGRGHIDAIAERLACRGHGIYIWHFDLFRGEKVKRLPKKNMFLIRPKTLPAKDIAMFFGLNAFVQLPSLFQTIRRIGIDAIISENILHGLFSFLVSGKTVLKLFDFSDYFPQSASIYYSKSSHVVQALVEGFVLFFTTMSIRLSDVCLVPCYALLDMAKRVDAGKPCYMVRNGVDVNLFSQVRTPHSVGKGLGLGENVITFVGLVEPWLDFATVVEGLDVLSGRVPDVQLLIVGPDKGKYQDRIRELATRQGVAKRIIWAGWAPYEDLPIYIQLGKCCVMPFRTDTALSSIVVPLKLFEYSACGKPILSTDLAEVKKLGLNHVLFYRNSEDFAQKAESLLRGSQGVNLSEQARHFAKEHDFEALATRLEEILLKHSKRASTARP